MKEQSDSQSFHSATDSSHKKSSEQSSSTARINKTRPIHKDRASNASEQGGERQKAKLTKQERAKIQKEKNRQAAQRSRDMHKEYVGNLEREIKQLKDELDLSRKYCYRCKQMIDNGDEHLIVQKNMAFLPQQQQLLPERESPTNDSRSNQFSEPDSFLRILEPQQENNILKLMLLVCMIIIGVMVGFNKEHNAPNPRTLMQIYSEASQNSYKRDAADVNSVEKWSGQKGLVELSREMENPVCLNSLMRVEVPVIGKNLRSIHTAEYPQQMQSILLCSLRVPKSYQIQSEFSQSPMIRLFVLGSQVEQLARRSAQWRNIPERNIQLNGIYQLSAELKKVQLVSQHSCLV